MPELRKKVAYWPSDSAARWKDLSKVCLEPDGVVYQVYVDSEGYYVNDADSKRTHLIWG